MLAAFLQELFHSLLIVSCIAMYKLDSLTRIHGVYVYLLPEGSSTRWKGASLVHPGVLFNQ